jgi:RHS repeat-associated protein
MFQYDQIDRLTSVSSGGTGLLSVRTYPLDGRGRRVSSTGPTFATEDDASFYYQYDTPTSTDRLGARRQFVGAPGNTSALGYNGRSYSWDVDGRVSEIENPPYNMFFGYSVDEQAAGRDAVFRSVSVTKGPSNGIFNYYYDSKGRRRLKVYPLNLLSDEYFYSVSNQLLEDRSMVSAVYLSGYSVDQYIWLGTRPVAMVKSRFDGSWLPSQESLCPRRGENAACGLYFIVTDHLPKPVLMLNKALQVVGTAEYDPFGYPNRQAVNSQALSGKPNQSRLFGVCEDPGASATGVQRRVRARFSFFDAAQGKLSADGVLLKAGGTVLDSETGRNRGLVVTSWVNPGSLPLGVYYYLDNDGITGDGVALESCEFRRYEAGVTYPVWTPIRFPGQYHDEETDLFENWNRYYDPPSGRYLQPEPLMQNPRAIASYAMAGIQMNPYAYAANNPLFYTDPNGLDVQAGKTCDQSVRDILKKMKESLAKSKKCECRMLVDEFDLWSAFMEKEVIEVVCHKKYIPGHGKACGYGDDKGQIDVSTRGACKPLSQLIAHELGHGGGSLAHEPDDTPGDNKPLLRRFNRMSRCFDPDGTFRSSPAPEDIFQ